MIEGYYLASKALVKHFLKNGIPLVTQVVCNEYDDSIKNIFLVSTLGIAQKIKEGNNSVENVPEEIKRFTDLEILKVELHSDYHELYFGIISFKHIDPCYITLVTEDDVNPC